MLFVCLNHPAVIIPHKAYPRLHGTDPFKLKSITRTVKIGAHNKKNSSKKKNLKCKNQKDTKKMCVVEILWEIDTICIKIHFVVEKFWWESWLCLFHPMFHVGALQGPSGGGTERSKGEMLFFSVGLEVWEIPNPKPLNLQRLDWILISGSKLEWNKQKSVFVLFTLFSLQQKWWNLCLVNFVREIWIPDK